MDEEETKRCYEENVHQVLISLILITSQTKPGLHKQLHQKKISMEDIEKLLKRLTKILKLSRKLNKQQKGKKSHKQIFFKGTDNVASTSY